MPADVADELDSQMESLEEGDGYDGDTQQNRPRRRSQQPRVSVRAREDATQRA